MITVTANNGGWVVSVRQGCLTYSRWIADESDVKEWVTRNPDMGLTEEQVTAALAGPVLPQEPPRQVFTYRPSAE